MQTDFEEQVLRMASGIAASAPASGSRGNAFHFRTRFASRKDRNAATEASIFIHGYSAGHDAQDRNELLHSIPASTRQHARIFAFWNSSHFGRFNKQSRRSLRTSTTYSLVYTAAFAASDRTAHFLKIRRRSEDMGRILFSQLENYLRRDYPNVKKVNLIGHSLGGRLIVSSLKSLAGRTPSFVINDVLLMAAAVEVQPLEAAALRSQVHGRLVNAYSTADWTLLLPFDENSLGRCEVEHFENVRIDGFGHCDYWKNLQDVFIRTAFGRTLEQQPLQTSVLSTDDEITPIYCPVDASLMTFKLETPSEVYQRINFELTDIISALDTPTRDATLDKAQTEARELLDEQKTKLRLHLAELEKNAEWNKFTIAFYGETGAGKSTLIEALRIILNEPEKVATQRKFQHIRNLYGLNKGKSLQLQHDIEQADSRLAALAQQASTQLQLHAPLCLAAQQALDEAESQHSGQIQQLEEAMRQQEIQHAAAQATYARLQSLDVERKQTLSLWQRILGFFRKAPEDIQLAQAHRDLLSTAAARDGSNATLVTKQEQVRQHKQMLAKKLSDALKARDDANAALRTQQGEIEQGKLACSQQQEHVARQMIQLLADLEKHVDGDIIGDGRADFTRETRRYDLQLDDQCFTLLDVPGIEGKEALVLDQIGQAVQKAHAVFYVTNQAAPPQTGAGEEHHKGTLEKIKEHLGAQTEVWTVFNKKITNAKLALGERPLTSSDEDASLADLDEKMREHLGTHYRGTFPLTALSGFLASTDHFLPDTQHTRRRDKMLADFSKEELLQKSRLPDFVHLLGSNLLKDAGNKINRSNLNKAGRVLDSTTDSINVAHQSFATLSEALRKDSDGAKAQLDSSFQSLNRRLEARGSALIDQFSSSVRNDVYARIDEDISDGDFKSELRTIMETCAKNLGLRLPETLGKEVEVFRKSAEDIIKRFEEQANELTGIYTQLDGTRLNSDFTFNIKIDSGINVVGLVAGIVGLVFAVATGGASLLLTIASASSVVLSIGKAVYKFFSTDYKKSQQRNATDENLRSACEQLRESLRQSLNDALPDMEKIIGQIKQALESPVRQAAAQARTLSHSASKMKALSLKIAKAGEI